jgi:hypothetical protein
MMNRESGMAGAATIGDQVTELHAMSDKGALGSARAVGAKVGVPVPTDVRSVSSQAAQARFREREAKAAEAWLYVTLGEELIADSMLAGEAFIRNHLRDLLKSKTRLAMSHVGGPG